MRAIRDWPKLLVLLSALTIVAAACGDDTPSETGGTTGAETGTGSIAEGYDFSGAQFVVGSKEFTEQLILGQITLQVLEAAGAEVTDETGLVGSTVVRKALESGEIDMYWEYTGTGWITFLKHTKPIADEQEQYDAVAQEDLDSNNIKWLAPAEFNNTYALAARTEAIAELGTETLSDLATLVQENPDMATFCGASEFLTRDDGLPGVEQAYGFDVPESSLAEVELGVVYAAVDKGDPCNFGEVFATDGRIAALDLTVLEDDKAFFPSYLPALNVRGEVFDQYPELGELFAEIAPLLDAETMRSLNAKVDVDGEFEEDVAKDWLVSEGIVPE